MIIFIHSKTLYLTIINVKQFAHHCQSSAIIHYSQQVAADSSFNEHRLNDSALNTHNNKPDIEMSSEYSSSAVQTAVELHLEQSKKKITLT